MFATLKVPQGTKFIIGTKEFPELSSRDITDNVSTLLYVLGRNMTGPELQQLNVRLDKMLAHNRRLVKHGHADAPERIRKAFEDIRATVDDRISE